MLTIHHHPTSRSFRIVWMAEEMGLPYEVRAESLVRRSSALKELNPVGALPAVVDGDLVMTESAAALQLIGERHGPTPLVPAHDDPAYPAFLEALHYGESSLAAYLTPLVHTRFMAPDDQKTNWTAQRLADMFLQRLAFAERRRPPGPGSTERPSPRRTSASAMPCASARPSACRTAIRPSSPTTTPVCRPGRPISAPWLCSRFESRSHP